MFKTVMVQFKNQYGMSKEYAYFTTETDLQNGDLVVVEAQDWYQVASVSKYVVSNSNTTRFVIEKLDLDQLEKDKEKIIEEKQIRASIAARVKEIEERDELRALSERDDVIKGLVERLDELKGQ